MLLLLYIECVSLFFVSGGLLHSIPSTEEKSDVESYINSALKECVHETSNGARDTAVNNLSDILFTFMKHLAWFSSSGLVRLFSLHSVRNAGVLFQLGFVVDISLVSFYHHFLCCWAWLMLRLTDDWVKVNLIGADLYSIDCRWLRTASWQL